MRLDQPLILCSEKHELTEQARQLIRTIRQMEASLDDTKARDDYDREDEELKVTIPLLHCIEHLKQKHKTIGKLHRERFEQVKSKLCDTPTRYRHSTDCQQNSPKHSIHTPHISNHPSSQSNFHHSPPTQRLLLHLTFHQVTLLRSIMNSRGCMKSTIAESLSCSHSQKK